MGTWGKDLWDKRGVVEIHTSNSIEFLDKTAAFMKDRIKIEEDYAKALRSLVKKYQFKKKEESGLPFTYLTTFKTFLDENDEFAAQRETIAEEINTKILKELTTLSATSKVERRKAFQKMTQMKDELLQNQRGLQSTKKKFDQASEEANIALKAYEVASNSLDYTKGQIQKLQKTSHERGMSAQKGRELYKTTLDSFNGKQTLYYEVEVPNLVQEQIQGPDEKRMESYAGYLTEFAEIQVRSAAEAAKSLEAMMGAAKSCDPAGDSAGLVKKHKTGVPHPGDQVFEEYRPAKGNSIGNKKKRPSKLPVPQFAELNFFTDLPQEKRNDKIRETIASLEQQLNELEKSGTAGDRLSISSGISGGEIDDMERIREALQQYRSCLPTPERVAEDPVYHTLKGSRPPSTYEEIETIREDPVDQLDKASEDQLEKASEDQLEKATEEHPPAVGAPSPPSPPSPPAEIVVSEHAEEEFAQYCYALYDFLGAQNGELTMVAGEEVVLLEGDDGSGWSKVGRGEEEGYAPTSYLQLK